ncbi:alpha/beta fold hydrolase [Agrococcus sp. ARC_14]|uniref:alpha/beta fold hydrolase n=1 Tax=Agrococcus sp. ARC_14 TaxID=2919927 RepID=UPI001F0707C0|nr:alpha/beta fold hydrolase [Agrococcus sp. ARC_14]MCH1882461.1 alpha/beta fold hydrolase [Agrococcus sp. ARC_14]
MTAPTASARLEFEGIELAYDVAGDPDAAGLVVLLPGMGDLRSAYRHLTPLLVAQGLRVAALDLPGHGDSGVSPVPVSQTQIARSAAALVELLGGPTIVVGHSFTPDSALLASQLAPEQVVGAVAIGPWATTPRQAWPMRALSRLVASTPSLWSLFYRSLHKAPPADLAEHRRRIVASLRRPGGTEALVTMAAGTTKDAVGARASQLAPVAIVMGDADPDFRDPSAEAQTYADAVSGTAADVAVHMVAGAGHYPHGERPAETAEAVLALARRVGLALGAPRA